jgi:hypothetical protein
MWDNYGLAQPQMSKLLRLQKCACLGYHSDMTNNGVELKKLGFQA